MTNPMTFADFLPAFFDLFTRKSFRANDYLSYLSLPKAQRGDEAAIVDTAIVGPLLGLLGFAPAERVYNLQRQSDRPDFAPTDAVYGVCFMVEDKNTSLDLTLDLDNPDSHLAQLAGYVRANAMKLGLLTNGRQLMLWQFDNPLQPHATIDLDIPAAIREWISSTPPTLSQPNEKALHDLFDQCRKAAFSDTRRLEREIAIDLDQWQRQALRLGSGDGSETVLVEALQNLVQELQREARRTLDQHMARCVEYADKRKRLGDNAPEDAEQQISKLRTRTLDALDQGQVVIGLEPHEHTRMREILAELARDVGIYTSKKALFAAVLEVINAARRRKYAGTPKLSQPWATLKELPALQDALDAYSDLVFAFHRRQAVLRHEYRADRAVYEDFTNWTSLVQETTLGDLNESQQRDEFALQAAYVVFIRLLLIRVCEDKGIFHNRFVSDGGLKHWQEDIDRYMRFANGNPYAPLLDMAYLNAQNIYAHFFTGRELFNWYRLDKQRFIMALHQLSRFNFADVDSDIVGTIYNTYVSRKEKREKGQYYTPPVIVHYILDQVGYTSGKEIIGANKRLIDPACGSGTFLVSAAKRLVTAYRGAAQQIDDPISVLAQVQNNLFGFDLNPFACYLAEVNLLIQVLDLVKLAHDAGQRPQLQRFHIYNVDALARPSGMYAYARFNMLLADENDEVDRIKRREPGTAYANGFAFVVANPPYGAALSDDYKAILRNDWADVFHGSPDTYTFFLKLGSELLARNGRLGFITPNTYLMGTHTAALRHELLEAGRIEQIVDLPQGIWPDANVDCVLLFLVAESDAARRAAQQVQINILGLRDTLDKLAARSWGETLTQPQARWMADPKYEMTIRYDDLLKQIEDACRIRVNGATKVLRLGDVTDSSPAIDPYKTATEGEANNYIKTRRAIPPDEIEWKPLLDSSSFIGRYELRWGNTKPYVKYGAWLSRAREPRFFESSKLLVQDMRNRALKRRLVATFDDQKFYNRKNLSNIIAKNVEFNLKYILALFNSSLLNYWFARQFDNLHINPSYFRQIPIYPADADTQTKLIALVDEMLAKNTELNSLRDQGYSIRRRRDGSALIDVPYDLLLAELQRADSSYATYTLFEARAAGLLDIPARCDLRESVSGNIFTPAKYPSMLVLRHNKLWFDVPDDDLRRYLHGYLSRPQWRGKTWDDIKNQALIPEQAADRTRFFTAEAQQISAIHALLDAIAKLDAAIDERVLDLYGITTPADRQRILGSAPNVEEEPEPGDEDVVS